MLRNLCFSRSFSARQNTTTRAQTCTPVISMRVHGAALGRTNPIGKFTYRRQVSRFRKSRRSIGNAR